MNFNLAQIIATLYLTFLLGYLQTYSCPNIHNIRNSVVIITGASSGVGAELAVQYGAYGANVVIAARRKADLEAVGKLVKEKGAKDVLVVPTDTSDSTQCEHLIKATIEKFGHLDTLVINHAIMDDAMFMVHNTTASIDKAYLDLFKVNVMGNVYLSRIAIPYLEETSGHIAVVSSASAKVGCAFRGAYVTSKNALHGFYSTLRGELNLLHSKVTIGVQVLSMIATPEITKEPALVASGFAMPVDACAAEMICAVQSKWEETYIPKSIAPWAWITMIFPGLNEFAVNMVYASKVERYVDYVKNFGGSEGLKKAFFSASK